MVIKNLLVSDDSEEETHQMDVYIHGPHYRLFKHILLSVTSFRGVLNSVRMFYNTSLLTES